MAGKDRTGVVAALILSVLGVPREVIVEDYLYTNQSVEKIRTNLQDGEQNNYPHCFCRLSINDRSHIFIYFEHIWSAMGTSLFTNFVYIHRGVVGRVILYFVCDLNTN
jgi:hypothetical protein